MAGGNQRKQHTFTQADFEIKQSSIRGIGKGLFALRTLYRGDTIGPYTGIIVDDEQCLTEPYVNSHYTLWICKDFNIVAEGKKASYTRYINHSDRPNARFVVSTRWKKARVEVIKRIRSGEEIFLDYGPAFWEASEITKKQAK
jgi:SET domain-containing protein